MKPVKALPLGTMCDGSQPTLFVLDNGSMRVTLSDYGAIVTGAIVPDGKGGELDVLLGTSTLAGLTSRHPYMGSTVGRYANRICGAKFSLDGKDYLLAANNGQNHLHGGLKGLDRRMWRSEPGSDRGDPSVNLSVVSQDGDQGYPGKLELRAVFTLRSDGALSMHYEARSDAATPLNITNHAYFNLRGEGDGTILGHVLELAASRYLRVGDNLIPVEGPPEAVDGGPMDFRTPKPIGRDLAAVGGYDHCYAIDGWDGTTLLRAARVVEPESGRTLEVHTDMPGIQFYSGNFVSDFKGKRGSIYDRHSGLCLEPEFYPDSPNRPDFPSCILRPGQTYRHAIEFRFGF